MKLWQDIFKKRPLSYKNPTTYHITTITKAVLYKEPIESAFLCYFVKLVEFYCMDLALLTFFLEISRIGPWLVEEHREVNSSKTIGQWSLLQKRKKWRLFVIEINKIVKKNKIIVKINGQKWMVRMEDCSRLEEGFFFVFSWNVTSLKKPLCPFAKFSWIEFES